jgi:hypothetical protein
LTADREKVVEDGDPAAAFLLGGEGAEIPDDEAARLGLGKRKQQAPAANKAAKPSSNK